MAKQALQFGDKKTADIKLHLIGSSGEECRGDPLLLHSQVLKKAEFFETKLSERWSSDKRPFEIEVTSCHSGENYIKFIHLMYSYYADEHFNFSSVDEALTILAISSEVMFHDCIEACMLYLNAVRWSSDQKTKIGALLSSLQLNILPDLAARLSMSQVKSECERIEMVKESLEELLSRALNGTEYRGRVEEHMLDYFGANASPAVKDACRYVLLKEFNANVEAIKSKYDEENIRLDCSTLSWLVGLIQRCDGKLFETVFKLFSEDTYLRDSLNTHAVTSKHAADDIHNILINRFLMAVSDGEIITPTSVRVSFLTNWVDTMVTLISSTRFASHHPPGSTSTPASGRSTAFGATSTSAFRSTPVSTQSFLFTPPAPSYSCNSFKLGSISVPHFVFDTFTASSTPSFGASSSTPSFGFSSTPLFGASSSTPSFGFSSTPAFGASSTPAFGSTTTSSKSTSGKNEDLTFSALKRGIIDVLETLPLDEQRRIYNIWKDTFKKHSILSPSTGDFNWWAEKLYDAIMMDKII